MDPKDPTVAGYRTPPAGPGPSPSPSSGLPPTLPAPGVLRPPAEPGELGRIGNYRVLRLIGSGGMGTVYQAEDLVLRRPVALKVMQPDVQEPETGWQRFQREAQTLAGINHRNLVTVYQAGQEGSAFFIAMELLQGESLDERVRRAGPMEAAEVLRVARETAQGLAAIHGKGLVHRDIKPSNIWLESPGGTVRILDFGLARPVQGATHLTQTGMVVGTPAFMAPEQARGEPTDARSDLFSLGSVLYCLATGTTPFRGTTLMAQLTSLAVDTPPPAHEINPRLPRSLSALIARLLEKDPQKRPPSAEALVEDILRIEANPAAGSYRKQVQVAVAVVACLALLGFALTSLPEKKAPVQPPPPGPAPAEARTPAPQDGRTYLVDLKETAKRNAYFPNGGARNVPIRGGPPDIFFRFATGHGPENDVLRGIGLHPGPDGETAFVTFPLDRRYARFHAKVTRNFGPRERARDPMIFRVLGDGKELGASKPISGSEDSDLFELDVSQVNELTLEVSTGPDPRACHGLWIDPYVK